MKPGVIIISWALAGFAVFVFAGFAMSWLITTGRRLFG